MKGKQNLGLVQGRAIFDAFPSTLILRGVIF